MHYVRDRFTRCVVGVILVALAACVSLAPPTPADLYGELFTDVQLAGVFDDGKTFVDAIPKRSPQFVAQDYRLARIVSHFDLPSFVRKEFILPPAHGSTTYRPSPNEDVVDHIDRLWPVLTRAPQAVPQYSSLLALPYRYVVPGGRFNEIYYWDSYFTMLGLQASGQHALVREMCDNFAYLVMRYGHVPNGNRTYYLSRSQPPFFASMVGLLAEHDGPSVFTRYRAALEAEYEFWMQGATALGPNRAHRRAVRVGDAVLNRYWDDRDTPREEAYREDVAVAHAATRADKDVYRNLRAAAESGWDFGSRWFADRKTRSSIRTVELVPVDLNAILYQLELTLMQANMAFPARAQMYRALAEQRRDAIRRYCWNERLGAFADYSWKEARVVDRLTAATVVPLYFGVASAEQARTVANTIRAQLLKQHGLVTSTENTGEQWDAPNGWAPLQWMAIQGLKRYGENELAASIAERWVKRNIEVYRSTGKLVEKYDVVATDAPGGGGEYPLQDGFGWTNGVLRALLRDGG